MNLYPWILSFHIVGMVAWMAGMLYLPRLFVYHCAASPGGELVATLTIMEGRLSRFIMLPAMIATWIFGLTLLALQNFEALHHGFMHAKLLLVLVMSGLHGFYASSVRRFAGGQNKHSQKFWRILNEVPALLLIGIVILIVVKPF